MSLDPLKQKIDVRRALLVFELVRRHGKRENEEYFLDGLFVTSDFDGYNLKLRDARVTLHIFFHNKFECNYDSNSALDNFIERIDRILRQYEGAH